MSIKEHILRRGSWGDRIPVIINGGKIRGRNPEETKRLLKREINPVVNSFLRDQSFASSMNGRRK